MTLPDPLRFGGQCANPYATPDQCPWERRRVVLHPTPIGEHGYTWPDSPLCRTCECELAIERPVEEIHVNAPGPTRPEPDAEAYIPIAHGKIESPITIRGSETPVIHTKFANLPPGVAHELARINRDTAKATADIAKATRTAHPGTPVHDFYIDGQQVTRSEYLTTVNTPHTGTVTHNDTTGHLESHFNHTPKHRKA